MTYKNFSSYSNDILVSIENQLRAGNARKDLENEIGESIVTSDNLLNYQYNDD